MNNNGKSHKELFEGLCKVLKENSQPLSEQQTKAVAGFLDVLVESINKNWGSTVKEFITQQKIASENQSKLALEKQDKVWEARMATLTEKLKESKKEEANPPMEAVMKALESLREDVDSIKQGEAKQIKEEFDEFRNKSVLATAEAIKNEKAKCDSLKTECDGLKEELKNKEGELLEANEKIAQLESALKNEQLKNYLESKISGLPAFEASLMRKRFSGAKTRGDIDDEFDNALTSVRERRNVASATMPKRDGVLEVQPSQLRETAKPTTKQNLLTEKTPAMPKALVNELEDAEDFSFIDADEALPQEDVSRWITALG